jgi:CheY-like chemotaxis protein
MAADTKNGSYAFMYERRARNAARVTGDATAGRDRAANALPRLGMRILVVDDNRDAAESLGMLLRLMGNEVRTVHDGLKALETADEFRPHVALLDIGLPRLNGWQAARELRHRLWARDLVLIALTGWAQEADRRKSSDAGFDHHLVKPVDLAMLQRLLERYAERLHARDTTHAAAR